MKKSKFFHNAGLMCKIWIWEKNSKLKVDFDWMKIEINWIVNHFFVSNKNILH